MSSLVHNRSVYSRGLNIMGQLGIKNKLKSLRDFHPIPKLQNLDISYLVADNQQTVAVANSNSVVLYWGWPLCTRTSYRFLDHYEKLPTIVRGVQKFTPFFKSGIEEPIVEATFANGISNLKMGCGYLMA